MKVTQITINGERGWARLARLTDDARVGVYTYVYGSGGEGQFTSVRADDVASQSMLARRIRKQVEAPPVPLDDSWEEYLHLFKLLTEG